MKLRIWLWSSTLALAAASGGIWLYASHASTPTVHAGTPPARASANVNEPTLVGKASAISRAGWEAGVEYVHTLDYRMNFGSTDANAAASPALNFHLRSQWKTTVSEVRGSHVVVAIELANVTLEAPGGASAVVERVKGAFTQPLFVEFDEHGRALHAYVTPGLEPIALGILRDVVTSLQFTTPQEPALRWRALEFDPAGEYSAEYLARSDGQFSRQKTGYARLAGAHGLSAAGSAPRPVIRSYRAEFALDDWGRVTRSTSAAEVATPLMGDAPEFLGTTRIELGFVSRVHRTGELPRRPGTLMERSLTLEPADFKLSGQNADRSTVGGSSFEQILSELDGLKPDDYQAASGVQHRLGALFRLDPAAIPKALAALNPRNAQAILGALGDAATPEAQKALASVAADSRRSVGERQSAVDAMFSLDQPLPEARKALTTLLNDADPELKKNASYMLGIMSRRISESEPGEAKALVGRFTTDLASAPNSQERMRALGALGNSGSPDALQEISKSLTSNDPAVRGASASALRFVPGAEADALVAKTITSDPDAGVRRAALMAASYRAYEPIASALESAAKVERDPGVRVATVATLATLAKEDGQSLILLEWMAQHDADASVREQASKAVQRGAAL
jgi:HEAT repeat protein